MLWGGFDGFAEFSTTSAKSQALPWHHAVSVRFDLPIGDILRVVNDLGDAGFHDLASGRADLEGIGSHARVSHAATSHYVTCLFIEGPDKAQFRRVLLLNLHHSWLTVSHCGVIWATTRLGSVHLRGRLTHVSTRFLTWLPSLWFFQMLLWWLLFVTHGEPLCLTHDYSRSRGHR
jgi:hypothetical protein